MHCCLYFGRPLKSVPSCRRCARAWEERKEKIAEDAKTLKRRLEEQRASNLKTIRAKVDGGLSDDDFQIRVGW
ncbi:MAG: hypothetical protein DMG96_27820 [Acidobacteria bacterium]|nr:MAG: hypothetical protein DMG98_22760 [Acidobacteriota bacterium]PYV71869.1 MAG: hypothetical protein DMG96_27820 [Acidobacteriota bacterium]